MIKNITTDEAVKGAPPLSVYIENTDGETLGGFTMPLPATREALRPFLDGIGITDEGQIAAIDITSPIKGLGDVISDYPSEGLRLSELNYLAAKLQALDGFQLDTFAAIVAAKRHCGRVADIINIVENIGVFDIQPAFSPKEYGEFLLEMEMDVHANAFRRVQEGDSQLSGLARYIEMLENHFDAAAFGRKAALEENGIFTDLGYLTEQGGFEEIYHGRSEIPAEYRVFADTEREGNITAQDVELAPFLLKLHALTGNIRRDAENIIDSLKGMRGSDYLLLMEPEGAYLAAADDIAEEGLDFFEYWSGSLDELHAFIVSVGSGSETVCGDIFRLDFMADSRLPDGDLNALTRWLGQQCSDFEGGGNPISTDDFLAAVNAAYMGQAVCPADGFLRITQETAKEMLARGDAKVYRLLPDGPLCLPRLSVVHNGLNFAEHREFAIRREEMAGLDKWAERAAAETSRRRERGEQKKSHGEEL